MGIYTAEYTRAYDEFLSSIKKQHKQKSNDISFPDFYLKKARDNNLPIEIVVAVKEQFRKLEKILLKFSNVKLSLPKVGIIGVETNPDVADFILKGYVKSAQKKHSHFISDYSVTKKLSEIIYGASLADVFSPDFKRKGKPTVPEALSLDLWNLDVIGANEAMEYADGSGVKIAIIDSGVDYTHPDLADRFGHDKGYDFINNDSLPMDENGHGTHVAGTVAGSKTGIARNSRLYSLRVLDREGYGSELDVIRAINYAIEKGYDIVNMSLGSPFPSSGLEIICNSAYKQGVSLVAAAGNEGFGESYPASYGESVIAVAAVDSDLKHAQFSNICKTNDISAPGVDVASTFLGGTYEVFSGTSMATPHVTGSLALFSSLNHDSSPALREDVLKRFSQVLENSSEYDPSWVFGAGLVRADEIVKHAENFKKIGRILNRKYFSKKHRWYYGRRK